MTARDSRGRFANPDHAAAERVLERAVREAKDILKRGMYRTVSGTHVEADHRHMAATTMKDAATVTDLLLRAES